MRCFDYEAYAEAAVTAFNNHLWYVSPRNVALAFFDDNIPNSEREGMRDVFVSKAMRKTKRGKRPAVLCKAANVDQTFTIASFITQDTKEFFEIMQIDTNFLETPVEDWNTDENYINGKKRCAALVVVNDVAERAVKLISDFNDKSTKDSKQQQYLLQVVEYHRKNHPMKY